MSDNIDENDCILCGKLAPSERKKFREGLLRIPLDDELICDACLVAFGKNVGFPFSDDEDGSISSNQPPAIDAVRP